MPKNKYRLNPRPILYSVPDVSAILQQLPIHIPTSLLLPFVVFFSLSVYPAIRPISVFAVYGKQYTWTRLP